MKLASDFNFEKKLWSSKINFVAGVDEVGRGAWAGPVVAAAVVFPKNIQFPTDLYDSKLLLPRQREHLSKLIYRLARSVGIGSADVHTINKQGISKATHIAFRSAIKNLLIKPDHILVDAFYIKRLRRGNQTPIKKGDVICASISAASIVAKVYRDYIMRNLSKKYPQYHFGKNKGYGTRVHQEAIRKNNFTEIHRRSFNLDYLIQ